MKSIIITRGNWQYRSENNHEDIEVILPPATVKPVEDGLIWKIKTQLMLHTESELNEHELAENIAFIISKYPSTPEAQKPTAPAGLVEELESRFKNLIKIFGGYDDGPSKMITGHCKDFLKITGKYSPAPPPVEQKESLEDLATRKDWMIEQCEIALMTEGYTKYERCYGNTAQEAEQAAFLYLTNLPDKPRPSVEGGKEGKGETK